MTIDHVNISSTGYVMCQERIDIIKYHNNYQKCCRLVSSGHTIKISVFHIITIIYFFICMFNIHAYALY